LKKKFLQNWAYRVSKEAEFCADFKNVQKSCVWKNRKKITEKLNFLRKNLWELLDARVLHIFLNQCKIPFLLIPFARCFFTVKSSKNIETVQYFKKTLFYKLVLGFQGQPKSHEAK
jgi:hypothetical protein